MNILLINAPSPDKHIYIRDTNRSGRRSHERTIWPQTGLAMIAAMFPDHNVRILDCIAEKISYKNLFEMMQEFKPDWVITNPISSTFTHDMIVCHYAKALGAKTVIVSPHAKALKEEVHGKFPSLDHVINYQRGGIEFEYLIRELITGQSAEGTTFSDFPPARQDLLPTKYYSLPFIGKNYTFVVISRGCPYKCIYCRQNVMFENIVRYRNVDSVIEEIKRYNLKNIAIHSDTATLRKDWMYEFCGKLPPGTRWITNSRVDTIDYELLCAMKKAGCWMVCYGIESGDNKVLEMNKKGATVEQAIQAVKWTKKAGIKVWGYFMLGLNGETKQTMEKTLSLAMSLPCDIANFSISAPYPGTEWNKIASKERWILDDRWESYDQNYSSIVNQPNCTAREVKSFQKYAYFRWFFSWNGIKFLWNLLNGY